MRALIFLLVFANLTFFAYAQGYFGRPESPDAGRIAQQVTPERIRIVARGEPPPLSAPAPTPEACLLWSGLIAAEADQLAKLVGERAPAARLARRTEATTAKTWWVFIPPLPARADADRKTGELKRLGVADFFVIQDAGPDQWALSLGVFSTEAAALAHLESLRGKGVKTARVGPRSGVEQHLAVELRGPEAELGSVRDAFGGRAAAACAASGTGTGTAAAGKP